MSDTPTNKPTAARAPRVVSLRHPGAAAPKPAEAPPPAPAADSPAAPSPSADSLVSHSRLLAETIVATFTDRLRSEVAKRGGRLTTADIDRIAQDLHGKSAQLEAIFRRTLETYVQARERAAFDHARQYPFDRLIVNTFAELFAPRRAELDGDDRVTRKVLPGFFMALDRMLPRDRLDEYQARCRDILSRLAGGDERVLDWQALYADAEANDLLLDALIALAPYFEAFEKRRLWFLPLVNDNLQGNGDDWKLTPRGFINLTLAIFAPLRHALRDISGRARLVDRYGTVDCQNIQRIVDSVWRSAGGR